MGHVPVAARVSAECILTTSNFVCTECVPEADFKIEAHRFVGRLLRVIVVDGPGAYDGTNAIQRISNIWYICCAAYILGPDGLRVFL
jgi:hypothetical protein